ncbi:MAG: zinc ABC transporter substrate-binding protein [Planctomycetota bacterium]|nr:zinc ABC transporter substrate-binding protein [Planctomycetota bacterium]
MEKTRTAWFTAMALALTLVIILGSMVMASCGAREQDQQNAPQADSATPSSPGASTAQGTVAALSPDAAVYTTFYPTTYFAERIAGGLVRVVCPLPAEEDPIFWQPSREALSAYQKAALIVVNGAEFEQWVRTASLPMSRVVDSAGGFASEFVTYETVTHSHGAKGSHTHEGVDGHTWVDPLNAVRQADAIRVAMGRRWPEHVRTFDENFRGLKSDLESLDAALREVSPGLARATLMASHPAYNYLAKRYRWTIENFAFEPDEPLTPEQVGEVASYVKSSGDGAVPPQSKVMLWEGDPLAGNVEALQALGVVSVVFTPVESLSEADRAAGRDYLTLMRENVERLRAGLASGIGSGVGSGAASDD